MKARKHQQGMNLTCRRASPAARLPGADGGLRPHAPARPRPSAPSPPLPRRKGGAAGGGACLVLPSSEPSQPPCLAETGGRLSCRQDVTSCRWRWRWPRQTPLPPVSEPFGTEPAGPGPGAKRGGRDGHKLKRLDHDGHEKTCYHIFQEGIG